MKQLVVASTFFQCLSLAAAADAGALPPADERILVLATSAQVPELATPLQQQRGFSTVAGRFDRVVDLAALVYPRRPTQFSPRDVELLTWQRLLRGHWQLGDEPVQVLMDSVQVDPALAVARIFADAELWAHSDGLMTYAPTRKRLVRHLGARLTGLVCVDLLPGLAPRLLSEESVAHRFVPREAVRQLIKEVAESSVDPATTPDHGQRPTAFVLGQYLGSLGILSWQEELQLHGRMIVEAARRGAEVCRFKPHPSAAPAATAELATVARDAGVELVVDCGPEIAEITMHADSPRWVLSCFSTGLATARYLLGIEAVAVGTTELLARLSPYENSNRVPLVLADVLFSGRTLGGRRFEAPDESDDPDPRRDLQGLLEAVAHCMQPTLSDPEPAATYLAMVADDDELLRTLFRRRRLTALGLPGALPPRWPATRLRQALTRRGGPISAGPNR